MARAQIHHPEPPGGVRGAHSASPTPGETDGRHDDSLLCEQCPGFAEVTGVQAELAALRERAERAEADVQVMEIARADAGERAARLAALLRPLLAALVVDVHGWLECDACTATWRTAAEPLHEDGCPVPPAVAELARDCWPPNGRGAGKGDTR